MKLNIALLLIGSASAFAPRATFMRPSSSLSMQDTSEAVKKALEASEKMGKTSPEARMAWELVEELDAGNAHEKALLKELEKKQAEIEALMKQVEQKKAASAQVPVVHEDTSSAVQKALEASRVYGKASVEARMAWEEVEEMDAANSHHKSIGSPTVEAKAPAAMASTPVENPKPATKNTPSPDVEAAISNALLLSKAYGKKAPEARLAWELVEELEARDSHKRALFRAALEKQAAESAAKATAKMEAEAPPKVVLHTDSANAVKAALAASKEFGATSVEARMAWELVEEIDATNAHHKTVGSG